MKRNSADAVAAEQRAFNRKLEHYQRMLQETLTPALSQALHYRDLMYQQISHYIALKNNIEMIKTKRLSEMDTMVNLGCDFYVEATV
jgi:hypothetical protein